MDTEILIAELAGLGFESFLEENDQLSAYIPETLFNEGEVKGFLRRLDKKHNITAVIHAIPVENWNAKWESEYDPILIDLKCMIRAPFHDPLPFTLYDIIIEPRMSFGTAHHETTQLMLSMLMDEEVKGMNVLDMGTGTGVIAILAAKMEAALVNAIDNDEWAFDNAVDNVLKNDVKVNVFMGDAHSIPASDYHIVIANINRNVLLDDIPVYSKWLAPEGVLLVSGFYEEDRGQITLVANESGLEYISHREVNGWTGIRFIKESA
jgi:ribosomal protein L11 methyltransferase